MSLPRNIYQWPADWQERFEERAAIMEYLGNMERPEAEQLAETTTRREYEQEMAA